MNQVRLFFILCAVMWLSPNGVEARTWTSSDGKTLEGEITSLEGDQITLKTEKGEFKFPLARLSEADQAFAKEWFAKKTAPEGGGKDDDKSVGDFANLQLGVWPNSVAAEFEVDQIQIVKEDKETDTYIYRSPHFEFHSPLRLSTSVVRDFSRMFEATFEFVKAMPIGLAPKPRENGYYFTQLYKDKNAYYADGGMQGSAGMHVSSSRGGEIVKSEIHVPLTSLGVEYTGARVIVDHKKESDTLIHEIAHQMTGRWLFLMPVWFTEGLAETVSTQRYDGGRFTLTSMDRSIREDLSRRSGSDRDFTMLNLERLMTISSAEWAADLTNGSAARNNYPSANVLFYYFLRIAGDGKGTDLVDYMKAVAGGMAEDKARAEILLKGKSFAEFEEEVAKGWRSEGLQLKFQ
ncbi:MAG: hypothetical protein KDM63_00545 [Verrucomicrobiae bacterium]|nr:hypothetical protein [Verrucomicrobiae bacterium]MCB1085505.1 hypothetical protein [Verrucomicrobiae bacterium]